MQGRQDYPQWVTKYRVSYSIDGHHFMEQNQVRNYTFSFHFVTFLSLIILITYIGKRKPHHLVLFIENWITGKCNLRVFIGSVTLGYELL